MKKVEEQLVIDLLKDSINHLENRIGLIDNRAGIFITGIGVFFALFTYIVKDEFFTSKQPNIILMSNIVLGFAFVIFIITILMLLQTIRPSKIFFGLKSPYKNMKIKNYVMWFDEKFPSEQNSYKEKINGLDILKIKENYEKVHFISLQLLRNKYKYYRWSVVGMKVLIVWCAIGISLLAFLKWYQIIFN